jgi:Rho termination factor, N-terminal domain
MNFTKAARTAAIATAATLNALAILAFAPKKRREQEIARAKRNIAERKAQIATRHPAPIAPTAPAETDNPIAAAPTPAPAPKPKRAIAPKNLSRLTTRELKAIAAKRKIRGAAKMNKSQLIAALA